MASTKTPEQHIAVFGESGSGKTVLLSALYGAAQEPEFTERNLYRIVADDFKQGAKLHKNYLGMRENSRTPLANRFNNETYSFTLKLKENNGQNHPSIPFNALRLVWHDYPGEWLSHGANTEEEAEIRLKTFNDLIRSDVALILVDSSRLLDDDDDIERYLKSLLGNLKSTLLSLQDELLHDGKKLVRFPRIWMFALTKCDLLPDYDAYRFRDLLIGKVAGEIADLRQILSGFVTGNEALSVGEDFVLTSSAKFESGHIDLGDRVGINLVLPLASALPMQRHLRWANARVLPGKVAKELLNGVGLIAAAVQLVQHRFPNRIASLFNHVQPQAMAHVANMADEGLEKLQKKAIQKKDFISAIIAGFQLELSQAESDKVLLRSPR
ncbi:energy-coupling factor transporter ATP-binding protein EcfA2 [Arthrobacter sp. JUb119]|uniref:TRAFAC clade GTPase domain-containing protein n=2 Tax=unclassified Glutamicibacter TaxID=2627139 RepID=UPI000FA62302|nr:energy-coupling factor transporter ATP-binding protein EcfA2 [Arthrobacter sp. JUb119]